MAPWLAARLPGACVALFSELVHASYFAYYFMVLVPPVMLACRGRWRAFNHTVLALTTVFVACFVLFLIFPAAGPRYLWPAPAGIPPGFFRALTMRVLEAGSSRGTAFPSSHVAIAVVASFAALRYQRPTGIVVALLTLLMGVGAVYGGYHYAIDVIAGLVLGLVIGARVLWRRQI